MLSSVSKPPPRLSPVLAIETPYVGKSEMALDLRQDSDKAIINDGSCPQDTRFVTAFRLAVDDPKPTDIIINHADAPVLAVDKYLEGQLPDSLIDIRDTPPGVRLSIKKLHTAQ